MTAVALAQSALNLKGAFDANLVIPETDPYWAPPLATLGCAIASISDLGVLTASLLAHRFDFAYLPSANCFFLRDDPAYEGIASALSPRTKKPAQDSVFVVKSSNPATRWQELRGARLGYINTYCTTSYFAPSILLAREGQTLTSFFDAFPVTAWQGQIDAVIDGSIDATMVYEDVWLAQPRNAAHTKILARLDDLPTPAFIARTDLDPAFLAKLKESLADFPSTNASQLLYAGFGDYQDVLMQRLFAEIEQLPDLRCTQPRRQPPDIVRDVEAVRTE
jgi:phosphonate transport system substrate-binding protein